MKKLQKLTPLWLGITVSLMFLCIVMPYLKTGTAFILGYDMQTIYSCNFENLRTMLSAWREKGTLPFWSWSLFLGNDFYSSKLFYFNDLYEYIFALTDLKYTTAIIWMTYLRFLTAAFCMYGYSRSNQYSRRTSFISALIFSFSAYLLQIMRDPFFASFMVFLPLYFMAVDRWIVHRKGGFYVFMTAFMYFNSYYLFYMTSLCTILYFIWRWQKEYGNLKGMMKQAAKLIGLYIIGFMISGIVTVPEVMNILSNARVGERSATLFYDSIVPYLDYLTGLFTPVSMVAYRSEPISSLYLYTTKNHQIMAVYLWASSICTLLIPQLFSKKNYKKINLIILILVSLFSLIPFLSSIMHGFSEPSFRWLANISFLMIAMILPFVEDPSLIDKKVLGKSIIVFSILLVVSTPLMALVTKTDFASVKSGWYLILLYIPFLIAAGLAMLKEKQKLMIPLVLCELLYVSYETYYGNPTQRSMSLDKADRLTTIMGDKDYWNQQSLQLDEKNSSSFYRTYIDPVGIYWNEGINYNLNFNIRGLMSYDSTYHASANDLEKLDYDHVVSFLPWTFEITNPDIMTLVSTKYAVVSTGTASPFRHSRLVGHFTDYMDIYENEDYMNLGKTYTRVITYDDYKPSDSKQITSEVICHKEDLEEIKTLLGSEEIQCSSAWADGNQVSAGLTASENGFAVLSVPYDKGWNIRVNGKEVKSYEVNGGLTGIPVFKGDNDIEMYFTPVGLKQGAILTAAGVLAAAVLALAIKIRKKMSLN